jgi:dihydrofolate reductase
LVARLDANGLSRLYVDGGLTIQSFLAADLIGEMTITSVPILLGAGKPLFGPMQKDVRLELLACKAFEFGFVQSKYRVAIDA